MLVITFHSQLLRATNIIFFNEAKDETKQRIKSRLVILQTDIDSKSGLNIFTDRTIVRT